jgi:hypothetical protein
LTNKNQIDYNENIKRTAVNTLRRRVKCGIIQREIYLVEVSYIGSI